MPAVCYLLDDEAGVLHGGGEILLRGATSPTRGGLVCVKEEEDEVAGCDVGRPGSTETTTALHEGGAAAGELLVTTAQDRMYEAVTTGSRPSGRDPPPRPSSSVASMPDIGHPAPPSRRSHGAALGGIMNTGDGGTDA